MVLPVHVYFEGQEPPAFFAAFSNERAPQTVIDATRRLSVKVIKAGSKVPTTFRRSSVSAIPATDEESMPTTPVQGDSCCVVS